MDNNVRDKIVLDLKKKYGTIDLSDNDRVRDLIKEIDVKMQVFKDEFTPVYLAHKGDVIFKRVLHNK